MTALDLIAAASLGSILAPALGNIILATRDFLASVLHFLLGSIIVNKQIWGAASAGSLLQTLNKACRKQWSAGQDRYTMDQAWVRPLSEIRHIWTNAYAWRWRIYIYKGWPILYRPEGEGMFNFSYLRGTVDFRKILEDSERDTAESFAEKKEEKRNAFRIIHFVGGSEQKETPTAPPGPGGKPVSPAEADNTSGRPPLFWRREDIGISAEGSSIDDLSLSPAQERTLRRIKHWWGAREWFVERGIPHRLGALFWGRPGAGKTSFARAIGELLDMPVCVFHLATMSTQNFLDKWKTARGIGIRMVVFEDFDTVFEGREATELGLTLTTVLNMIDGLERENGLLLIVTTNHPEKIDPAMGVPEIGPDGQTRSTRPSRLDIALEFGELDLAGRIKLARRILRDEAKAQDIAARITGTGAQFQDACMREAAEEYYAEMENVA